MKKKSYFCSDMKLVSLDLHNFKNIPRAAMEFSPKVNCFLGHNGMGKSNLLDAIYYLSFCKSFTGVNDSMVIRRGEEFCMVSGVYDRRGTEEKISAGLAPGRRKSFKRGGKEYQRLSEHIGLLPLVMVSPRDMDLVTGPAEERRKFLDMVISQGDPAYLDALIRYNRALTQRNAMLREGVTDDALYGAVEMAMALPGEYLYSARKARTARLQDIFTAYYRDVAPEEDSVTLSYISALDREPDLCSLLRASRRRDSMLRHTSEGLHRDDIELTLGGLPVKRTASQGQAKTFTIALRLAQYDFLSKSTGMKPLLLLDDIFDKLDASRVERIMDIASREEFGQIFITDTNRRHLDAIVADMGTADFRLWGVERGCFSEITPKQ